MIVYFLHENWHVSLFLILKPLCCQNLESPLHIEILAFNIRLLSLQGGQKLLFSIPKKSEGFESSLASQLWLLKFPSEESKIRIYFIHLDIWVFYSNLQFLQTTNLLNVLLKACDFFVKGVHFLCLLELNKEYKTFRQLQTRNLVWQVWTNRKEEKIRQKILYFRLIIYNFLLQICKWLFILKRLEQSLQPLTFKPQFFFLLVHDRKNLEFGSLYLTL